MPRYVLTPADLDTSAPLSATPYFDEEASIETLAATYHQEKQGRIWRCGCGALVSAGSACPLCSYPALKKYKKNRKILRTIKDS